MYKTNKTDAKAVHVTRGEQHVVGIGNLRVFILPDGPFWFAQGLEIDYAAQGNSIEDAKKNFENGLAATIDLHLKVHQNIEDLLEPAPREVLQEAVRELDSLQLYSQVSVHETGRPQWALPFGGIDYWAPKEKTA
jgi:hypothetical protein